MTEFPWKRFWGLRDSLFHTDDAGFLADPTSGFGLLLNPDVKSLEELLEVHFLGLVGEAGSGKTHTPLRTTSSPFFLASISPC